MRPTSSNQHAHRGSTWLGAAVACNSSQRLIGWSRMPVVVALRGGWAPRPSVSRSESLRRPE